MIEQFESTGTILGACEVEEKFCEAEKWKEENCFEATKLGRKMQFLDLWIEGILPVDIVENLDLGVFIQHNIYEAWRVAGQELTPHFINTHRDLWRENYEFEEWVDNSNTGGTSWLENSVKSSVCPPLLLMDRKIFGLGYFIDGRHRAMIFSRLVMEGKLDNTKIPVLLGHIPKVYWYLYNLLLFAKSPFDREDSLKILKSSLDIHRRNGENPRC